MEHVSGQRALRPAISVALIILFMAACTSPEVKRGDEMAEAGRWDEAVEAYREAVKKKPFDDDIKEQLDEAKAKAAEQHYVAGKAALKERRVEQAVEEIELSMALDPSRSERRAALADALRLRAAHQQLDKAEKLKYLGRLDDAMVSFERAATLDPQLEDAFTGITEVTIAQRATWSLAKSKEPITLRFQKAKLREVFEILARTADINVVFDKDVRDDPITIFLKDMPYDEALKLIMSTNNLLAHRVAPRTVLITPNTKQKKAQYQDMMIRTFYLSNAEAKKTVNLVRSMLESKRVYADEAINAIVVRDTPAKLNLAERMIYTIDRPQPEVMLEVEVLEVDRTENLEYGLDYQKSASFLIAPTETAGGVPVYTIEALKNLGASSFLVTFPSGATLNFLKQENNAKTLASPKIRVVNGEKATINVGDKEPILLSTTNVLPGQAATGAVPTTSTVTSTEFKDTGIRLTVEPTIHLVDEITLKLKVEVTRRGEDVVLSESPRIVQPRFGTRTAETKLRVRDGETVVLAGLIQEETRRTQSTVPLLGDIPYLGKLFTSTQIETRTTEIILTIRPRIVRRMETPDVGGQAFWSGTQTRFSTKPVFVSEPKMASLTSVPLPGARAAVPEAAPEAAVVPQQTPERLPPGQQSGLPPLEYPGAVDAPGPSGAVPQPATTPGLPTLGGATPPPDNALLPAKEAGSQGIVTAGGAGVLAIRPSRLLASVGQQFRVDVTADQLGSFTESVVTVGYNPQFLEFVRAADGEVLRGATGPSAVAVVSDPDAGQVSLRITRQGSAAPVSGALASIFFRAKAAGTSQLTLGPATVTGTQGESLSVSVRPAAVVVR